MSGRFKDIKLLFYRLTFFQIALRLLIVQASLKQSYLNDFHGKQNEKIMPQ